jgi:GNAT superfamily N-acetyltransferase
MLIFSRCDGKDPAFRALVAGLDEDLLARYGAQMDFFGQYNRSDDIATALVARFEGEPAGCGCFKPFSQEAVEIKRMYVPARFRGRGVARAVLRELEAWARELGYRFAVVETGVLQPEAIRLYETSGYARIPNYPPYEGVRESVCFHKPLA